jgi:hypothetical protein
MKETEYINVKDTPEYAYRELLIKQQEEHEKQQEESEKSWKKIVLVLMFIIFLILTLSSKPNDPQYSGQSHYDPR